ncbi:helix-turn-helix domain-containing protein [Acrocarpospora macrocephala]|nr:helix-turn-helix transcriptional regulator [Acrocarpospora macrocephala]
MTMTRTSLPARPNAFPSRLLGYALRWWRDVRGMSLREVAEAIRMDHSHLAKLERGERPTPPYLVPDLDRLYTADGQLMALHTAITHLDQIRANTLGIASPAHGKDEDMERRRLLQLAAATAGLGALGAAGEPVRQLLDLSLNHESRSIEEWELAVAAHLYGLRTRPAAQVRDDLVVDLMTAQRQLDRTPIQDKAEIQRVIAALSTLHANALTRLGDHGAALRWWRTARVAAHESGDLQLELGIYATETGHANYGQRDPLSTLQLIQGAQQIAGTTPSLGLALVTCSEAKTLALLGRHDEARRALNHTSDLLEVQPPPPSIMPNYWQAGQLPFAENLVHTYAGKEAKASEAKDRSLVVLGVTGDQQYSSILQLHDALCAVLNGGIDQGVQSAASVINDLPTVQRSNMIMETGRKLLRAVPIDRRDRPAVGEFRELLAIAPATSA